MPKRRRGRPNLWREGRRLRALWQEAHAATGIGLRRLTELWAAGALPKGVYPGKVTAEALRKAIRRSVMHKIRDESGKLRIPVPTVLDWAVIGVGGAQSGGAASTLFVPVHR
jgi:hypothetical protein